MWAMKVFVPGGTLWMAFDEEPRWMRDKEGRVYLKYEVPATEPPKYKDAFYGLNRRIYKDEVYTVGPWEMDVTAGGSSRKTTQPGSEIWTLLDAITTGQSVLTYTELKREVGWGQKKLQRILKEADDSGWYTHTKQGSRSIFGLSEAGYEEHHRLSQTFDPELYRDNTKIRKEKGLA
jgi:hypothetical protein